MPMYEASGWAMSNARRSAKIANSSRVVSHSPPATGTLVLPQSCA